MQQEQIGKQKSTRMILEQSETLCPEQFDSVLINYLGNKCEGVGKLVLTDFRCLFITTKETIYHDNQIKFDFPLGYITKCESSSESINKSMVFYLEIVTKFTLSFKLKSASPSLVKASEYINRTLATEQLMFGEKRTGALQDEEFCHKWETYYNLTNLETDDAVVYDNTNWSPLPMYPSLFKVPKPFIGKRNPTQRLILLSCLVEQKKKVGLWRNGPGRNDSDEEKWVPAAAKKDDHTVVQIKSRSLGSSKSLASETLELDGAPQLRQSFGKMLYSSCFMSQQLQIQQKWLVHVNSSRWFEQMENILQQAFRIHQKLNQGKNVTIISDWDIRGAQISSLIQIISQPENRTIKGFAALIQREFLHFGNWFNPTSKKEKGEDKGIALIQLFDCVHQLLKMYPLSFQFNDDMLTYLAIHVYSRKYGNFLFSTRTIEETHRLRCLKFGCVWEKIYSNRSSFTNSFFVNYKECDLYELKRPTTMKNIVLWASFFLRDIFMYGNALEINLVRQHQRVIHQRHQAARIATEELRKKIADQHKQILEKKQELSLLEQNILD